MIEFDDIEVGMKLYKVKRFSVGVLTYTVTKKTAKTVTIDGVFGKSTYRRSSVGDLHATKRESLLAEAEKAQLEADRLSKQANDQRIRADALTALANKEDDGA